MITTIEEVTERLYSQLGESASLVAGDYDDDESQWHEAVNIALSEMGVSLPLSNSIKEYWLLLRGRRHVYDLIRVSSARKFKYKQINLDQRFAHFDKLIQEMDDAWAIALDTVPELMGADGIGLTGDVFMAYVRPGFVYSRHGKDLTYTQDE
jgi:hypothetical protein